MQLRGILSLAFLLAGLTAPELHAGAGSEAAAFLKLDAGARAAAMGGAFAAAGDDASSVFYNPAGPALARKQEVMLSHNEWLAGLKNEHAAYLLPVSPRLTLFTGFAGLISPSLDRYDDTGARTGSFSAMDGEAGAGLSWEFRKDLFGGFFAKTVFQQADNRKASAYAVDLGVVRVYEDGLRLGAAAQNLGTKMKLYSGSFDLPRTYRAGAAYRVENIAWLTAEIVKAGQSPFAIAAGAEGGYSVGPKEEAFARLGFRTGRSRNSGSGLAAGAGLRSEDLRIDYAFSPFGELGDTHRITVTLKFGEARGAVVSVRKVQRSYDGGQRPSGGQKRGSGYQNRKPVRQGAPGKDKSPAPSKNQEMPVYFMW